MEFTEALLEARFLRRYKRFFADIEIDGKTVVAHVPNTGSLRTCLKEGSPCRYSISPDPKRKLPYTLQMVRPQESWIGVNTHLANGIVWGAWETKAITHWQQFDTGQREIKINAKTRLDMAFWNSKKPSHKHFVEVKSVTLAEGGLALFPDAVTDRGLKHLDELANLLEQGFTSEIVFVVQRRDCRAFAPADHIDPAYGRRLREVLKAGVKISAYACDLTIKKARLLPRPLSLEI